LTPPRRDPILELHPHGMKEAVMASRATLDGKETRIDQQALEQPPDDNPGDVLTPEDPSYAGVRIPFNAMHPGQPAWSSDRPEPPTSSTP